MDTASEPSPIAPARSSRDHDARLQLLFCLVTAAAFLAICSKNSFLYPMNDWVDVNCFRTVGNAMLHGQVLYRDIYEQKGPLLYFLYMLTVLVSPRSFLGAYLLETVSFAAFLYQSGRCVKLYLPDARWTVCGMQIILAASVTLSGPFAHGGSAEELCLFMVPWSMHLVLRAMRERRPIPGRDAFLVGLFASAALWIKYSFCGFYAGLAAGVLLYHVLGPGQARRLPGVMGGFLLGMTPITGLVLVYFACNGALADLFQAYFYNNLFLYGHVGSIGPLGILRVSWERVLAALQAGRVFMWLCATGLFWFLTGLRTRLWEALTSVVSLLALIMFVYIGGSHTWYYELYIASFGIFGLIGAARLAWRLIGLVRQERTSPPPAVGACLCGLLAAGLLVYSFRTSPNVYLMSYDREDMPQYQFAQIIRQRENPTLLNYLFLDGGFYFAADLVPTTKFFCTLYVQLPEMIVEQNRCIWTQATDFVVVRGEAGKEYMDRQPWYHLVAESSMYLEYTVFPYYLYEAND